MNENLRIKNGSLIRRQIESLQLPEGERRNLLELAATAELVVGAVIWTARRAGDFVGSLSLKPSAR
jgi:hypothetical protein